MPGDHRKGERNAEDREIPRRSGTGLHDCSSRALIDRNLDATFDRRPRMLATKSPGRPIPAIISASVPGGERERRSDLHGSWNFAALDRLLDPVGRSGSSVLSS